MRVTLKARTDGTFVSSDRRWTVAPDPAREPGAYILTDTTGRERPHYNTTLEAVRAYIGR